MMHVFHGFLGPPEDFSFLAGPGVKLYDLTQMSASPMIRPEDTLLGYSLGGRIALSLADKVQFKIKKLVLLGAHPGLQTPEERHERALFEKEILLRLEKLNFSDFLLWWNKLPLFQHDRPIEGDSKRFDSHRELFKNNLLSGQKNYLPELIKHQEKILYIAGSEDKKYSQLAESLLAPNGIKTRVIPSGHRLFQHSEELKKVLKEEGII